MIRLLATVLTGFALGSAAGVLLLTASWRAALRTLLELLMAAGLVRLAAAQSWTDLAAAAAIVVIRNLLSTALLSPPPRPPGWSAAPRRSE